MQQSKKMEQENQDKQDHYLMTDEPGRHGASPEPTEEVSADPVVIRPIVTFNDWVMILQDKQVVKGGVIVKDDELTRPEGIVVGIPDSIPDGHGSSRKPQVKIGDRVAFQQRSILTTFSPAPESDSPYRGKAVVVLSERNIIYRLPPVPFVLVD